MEGAFTKLDGTLTKYYKDPKDNLEVTLGAKYPIGVYNVVVSQGTEMKTLRAIQR